MTALNTEFGNQDSPATVHDTFANDWASIDTLIGRVSKRIASHPDASLETYRSLLEALKNNAAMITPSKPEGCSAPSK